MNDIEEIKGRLDIVDLISQYVVLKKAGANFKGVCPFHQEKTASLMVSPQKQIWKCFGCGKGGDHFAFIMESEHLEFGDALRLLAQKTGVQLQERTRAEHQTTSRKELLYRINQLAARIFQKILLETPHGAAALQYLEGRGLNRETIKKFGIGFASKRVSLSKLIAAKGVASAELQRAGSPEKFFERIMFPIYDVLGNVIAFTGRAMGEAQPKYLNSPETQLFNKGRVLYGLNFAKAAIKQHDRVVLVEGQMDVIALSQGGTEEVVASSGTAVTEQQLLALSKYTSNFILAFDNDTAGKTTTEKVIELLLRNDLNGKVVSFGSYKDAGELFEKDAQTWPKALNEAMEMVDWLIADRISQIGPLKFVENKKKATSVLLPILRLVQDPTKLDYYLQRLASLLEVQIDSLYAALRKVPDVSPVSTAAVAAPRTLLTNEEQLLTILLAYPQLGAKYRREFDDVVWRSVDADRIASEIKKWYTDTTLVKNASQFSSRVKTELDSQLSEKISSWEFWLANQWAEISPALAEQLVQEKFSQLSTRQREQQKTTLAAQIQQAQQKGDIAAVKQLMKELSQLAKDNK